jgi:hypothetical protein
MDIQEEIARRFQKLEAQNQILSDNVSTLVNDLNRMALIVKQTNEQNMKRDFNIAKLFKLVKCVINFITPRHPEFDMTLHQNNISDLNPEK